MTHDQAYYLSRAEAELALARCAPHPAAMRAHYHLAGFYLDKVHGSRSDNHPQPPAATPLAAPTVEAA